MLQGARLVAAIAATALCRSTGEAEGRRDKLQSNSVDLVEFGLDAAEYLQLCEGCAVGVRDGQTQSIDGISDGASDVRSNGTRQRCLGAPECSLTSELCSDTWVCERINDVHSSPSVQQLAATS